MIRSLRLAGVCLVFALSLRAQTTITAGIFTFDFTYDSTSNGGSNFFGSTGSSTARNTLQLAGQYVSNFVSTTTLSAITPGGTNSWTTSFYNPADQSTLLHVTNPTIASSSIYVYAGGNSNLALSSTLGQTTQGGFSFSGDSTWQNTLNYRGNGTNNMPWGGSISFNTLPLSSWYYSNTSGATTVTSGQYDFFSVAVHELFHLLGFGTSATYTALVSGTNFTGTHASSTGYYGSLSGGTLTTGAIPLNGSSDTAHWRSSPVLYSFISGSSTLQEVLMDPNLSTGARKFATTLDLAALQDIGYTVASPIPEPADTVMFAAAGAILFAVGRRVRTKRRKVLLPEDVVARVS